MGKPGMFKSAKRKKEIARQKKQEEKRQRRLNKNVTATSDVETTDSSENTADIQPPVNE